MSQFFFVTDVRPLDLNRGDVILFSNGNAHVKSVVGVDGFNTLVKATMKGSVKVLRLPTALALPVHPARR